MCKETTSSPKRFETLLSSRDDWTRNRWCVVKPDQFLLCACDSKGDARMIAKIFNRRKGGTESTVEWTQKTLTGDLKFARQFALLVEQSGYLQAVDEKKSRCISVRLRFRVKLKNKYLLETMRSELGFGTIVEMCRHDGYFAEWQTGKRNFIVDVVIPMVDRFPPKGDRHKEYQLWRSIALKVVDRAHLDNRRPEVLALIRELESLQATSLIKLKEDTLRASLTDPLTVQTA